MTICYRCHKDFKKATRYSRLCDKCWEERRRKGGCFGKHFNVITCKKCGGELSKSKPRIAIIHMSSSSIVFGRKSKTLFYLCEKCYPDVIF